MTTTFKELLYDSRNLAFEEMIENPKCPLTLLCGGSISTAGQSRLFRLGFEVIEEEIILYRRYGVFTTEYRR